VDERVGMQVKL